MIYQAGVYSLTFPDGSKYIGGSGKVAKRIQTHLSWLRQGKGQTKLLQERFEKYGEPKAKILIICAPKDIPMYEQIAFAAYKPILCKPQKGGNAGRFCSKEAR